MNNFLNSINVIQALIIRDLMVRFGRGNLGFFWTVLEPMILTAGVMLVWSLIKEPVIHGIPIITFILTGYMPLTLWRHMTNPVARLLHNNAPLFYHRLISSIHVAWARLILEFLSTSISLLLVYFIVVSTGLMDPAEDYSLILCAWIFTAWYFGALGLAICAWTERSEILEKFIQPSQYLALPVSGVFFMVDWVPTGAQNLLLLNPSVHCFEMFRAGMLGEGIVTHYSPLYMAASSTLMSIIALSAMYRLRDPGQA